MNNSILNFGPKIKLYLFPGNYQGGEHQEAYEKAFTCWREVWESVFKNEMNQEKHLYADDFLRQDQVVALFAQGQCVGVAFMRTVNLKSSVVQNDSFFRFWQEEHRDKILKTSSHISLASYFTVHPDFRQQGFGVCWKTLLLGLFVEAFRHGETDLMITAARKVRSNEKLCRKLGAKTLASDVPYLTEARAQIENEIADMVYWDKSPFKLDDEFTLDLQDRIWSERISLVETTFSAKKEVKDAA
jgi:GNAT superfamily N-acetyltransferase